MSWLVGFALRFEKSSDLAPGFWIAINVISQHIVNVNENVMFETGGWRGCR